MVNDVLLGMLLILALAKASHLEYEHSSARKSDGFQFQSNDELEKVELVLGGDPYIKIYFPFSVPIPNKRWDFVTKPRAKIAIDCTRVNLRGFGWIKFIGGSRYSKNIIINEHDYSGRSSSNTFSVILRTNNTRPGGIVECLVEAVDGSYNLQFMNVWSQEIDSSEYGVKKGAKQTTCKCGTSSPVSAEWEGFNERTGRIIGGDEVREGQYPWMVSLCKEGTPWCGGSIITEYHILTAAHCVVNSKASVFTIRTGTVNVTYSQHGQEIRVAKILSHNYDGSDLHKFDIAILLLEEKIVFNDFVARICLTSKRIHLRDKYITAMGWGSMGKKKGHKYPEHMLRVHVRVIDYNTCNHLNYRRFNASTPDRICIYSKSKSICNGDSGSPAVWLDPEINRYVQVGVASFGLKGCAEYIPAVFTDVVHYYSWIKKVIADTKPSRICEKKKGFLSWLL